MFKFLFIFYIYIYISSSYGSDEKGNTFIQQLLEWNIDYKKLDDFKSGAGCITKNKYQALGLSYNLADINYAKKIALQGCEQMKKKNKILNECNCEIIFINNNFVTKE